MRLYVGSGRRLLLLLAAVERRHRVVGLDRVLPESTVPPQVVQHRLDRREQLVQLPLRRAQPPSECPVRLDPTAVGLAQAGQCGARVVCCCGRVSGREEDRFVHGGLFGGLFSTRFAADRDRGAVASGGRRTPRALLGLRVGPTEEDEGPVDPQWGRVLGRERPRPPYAIAEAAPRSRAKRGEGGGEGGACPPGAPRGARGLRWRGSTRASAPVDGVAPAACV